MQEISNKKSPIKQRILQYLSAKGVTQYDFCKKSGITRGLLAQNNGISEENISRFLDYAPDVNVQWLITGDGEMYNDCDKSHTVREITADNVYGVNVKGKVSVNQDAYDALLKVVEGFQHSTERFQDQTERMIALLEKRIH